MNRKQREKARRNSEKLDAEFGPKAICTNCGEPGSHYAPPSFRCPGFYMCVSKGELIGGDHESS